jgi:hypothetical protein
MHKVAAVEEAKTLLEAAKEWGVWKWLTDKKKMRDAADKAWAAFDEVEAKVRGTWSDDLQKAYAELSAHAAVPEGGAAAKKKYDKTKKDAEGVAAPVKTQARKLRDADQEAYAVRMEAENMFVEAEKRMNTGMARDAAQKAIDAYAAREKVIRKFETVARAK